MTGILFGVITILCTADRSWVLEVAPNSHMEPQIITRENGTLEWLGELNEYSRIVVSDGTLTTCNMYKKQILSFDYIVNHNNAIVQPAHDDSLEKTLWNTVLVKGPEGEIYGYHICSKYNDLCLRCEGHMEPVTLVSKNSSDANQVWTHLKREVGPEYCNSW